ncbi:50S ribosomal protein L2 [Mycoplasma sp. SG1]|uniref:50S ribosomal protein L2 n=1 Tax=Mycoplasma sp. SG1 TaxID=2810348 RepID=UPI002024F9AE|nr:50S ribosomal protein L2 [Mycoplasma sp. SG1]URM52894.1 50S ribosomal protein L2 [Mycoplasma sp. SG1]
MAIRINKPISNGQRNRTTVNFRKTLSQKNKPYKPLTKHFVKKAGRNNQGKITVRHQGGGKKQLYRFIDFKKRKYNVPGTVKSVEYDPNRSANIGLVSYADGQKLYTIGYQGMKVGDKIVNGSDKLDSGNTVVLKNIPIGTFVHNIELQPGQGAKLVRSAGTGAQIISNKDSKYTIIQLPSGERRKILNNCHATIGVVGNSSHNLVRIGKAGRNRWLNKRPTVRGSAMNPVDHPHGGGEGKSPIGRKAPYTPWGKKALGVKTRSKKKLSNKFIIRSRKPSRKKK